MNKEQLLKESLLILSEFVDNEKCDYDHHGGCQSHGFLSCHYRCPMQQARELLKEAKEICGCEEKANLKE